MQHLRNVWINGVALSVLHAHRVENVKARVISKEQAVQAEKQKRREEVLIQFKKRKAVEKLWMISTNGLMSCRPNWLMPK